MASVMGHTRGEWMRRIPYIRALTQPAKMMRKAMTPAENKLWKEVLSNKKLHGTRWMKQRPIDKFIVDFYCPVLKIAIEVDGGYHDMQKEADSERTEILANLGIMVIRFNNNQILDAIDSVKKLLESTVCKQFDA